MKPRNVLKTIFLVSSSLLLSHCGSQGGNSSGTSTCGANVVGEQMALAVTEISTNVFTMQLCAPPNPPAVFSVYGGATQSDVTPPTMTTAAVRLSNVRGATEAGQGFQVTFKSTDTFFAIYQDQANGDGTYSISSKIPMVSAHPLPNRGQ